MILIADSGSTKTDWLLCELTGKVTLIKSIGLNPVLMSSASLATAIGEAFKEAEFCQKVLKIYYFGAGCWNEASCDSIKVVLQSIFSNAATIEVQSDILGAVRATCGKKPGITCILGTGANSCLFDGTKIVDAIPSLGYILGDEGSGAVLGKKLVQHYFYRELPKDLHQRFFDQYQLEKAELIDRVYQQKRGNSYLASFTPFLSAHIEHPFIIKLLNESFDEFLVRHVLKYKQSDNLPIHFVGSIAYHFKEVLANCISNKKLYLGNIIQQPIEALGNYYRSEI